MRSPPTPSLPPPHLEAGSRRSYGAIADPNSSLYQMLHLEPTSSVEEIEAALRLAQRWWNAQQANPKYRTKAGAALARLQEARELLLDPLRRQEYDRQLQHFEVTHRARRWQPVRDLIEVLLEGEVCTHAQHNLLLRFAARRGFTPKESMALLHEELLQRDITLLPAPTNQALASTPPERVSLTATHRLIITMMAFALLGIFLLPFFQLSRPALLLAFPFFNNLRLFIHDLTPMKKATQSSNNGWDWLVGIAVLGGATITALVELQSTQFFALGLGTAGLIWLSWLRLFFLLRKPPSTPAA